MLAHLPDLVVKEVHGAGGYGMLVGPAASRSELEAFRRRLVAKPGGYIAQPTLALSTCPTFVASGIAPRHVDLRAFVLSGETVRMVAGGLTRVALSASDSLVVNSSQGGGTKDTWVLQSDGHRAALRGRARIRKSDASEAHAGAGRPARRRDAEPEPEPEPAVRVRGRRLLRMKPRRHARPQPPPTTCSGWPGYMERAENTARMLDVHCQTASLPQPPALAEAGWRSLLSISQLTDDYRHGHGEVEASRILAFMVSDARNASSISSCLRAARENARAARAALTTEVWETANQTWLDFDRMLAAGALASDPAEVFEWVKVRSHLSRGVAVGTMLQDEAFRFMRIGSFLERADNTARLLDAAFHAAQIDGAGRGGPLDGGLDVHHGSAILRAVSAFEAYRKAYRTGIQAGKVAELLILRRDMPRSLAACTGEIVANLAVVANAQSAETLRRAGRLESDLRFGRIDEILATGLHAYLTQFLDRINDLGRGISRDFLAPRRDGAGARPSRARSAAPAGRRALRGRRAAVSSLCVHLDPVASLGLGPVAETIGALERLHHRFARPMLRDAGREREGQLQPVHVPRRGMEVRAHAFERRSRGRQRRVGQQQHELLAAPAGEHIRLAQQRLRVMRQRAQHRIADGVPVRVVDALEVVEIDERHAPRRGRALAAQALGLQQLLHATTVHEAGQLVVRGQAMDVDDGGLELGLLQAQPCAQQLQAHGQQGETAHHHAQHREVEHLQAGRVALGIAGGHLAHHDGKEGQREEPEAEDALHRQAEGAEHQDDREQQAGHRVGASHERVGPGRAEHAVEHLRHGHRRVAEAPVEACVHGGEHEHRNRRSSTAAAHHHSGRRLST